jgi:hypothetical protein
LGIPEANVLWDCQYFFHHPEENCSIRNELISSQKIIACGEINELKVE